MVCRVANEKAWLKIMTIPARMQTYWLEAQQKCDTLGGYLAESKTAW
jgi:hypothetical protein